MPAYTNLKEVSIDPYVAMRNAYLQNYDYGMAKVLKQEQSADDSVIENDKAVLGVLGLDSADVENQVATNGGGSVSSEPPVMLKSKLATINKASQVDEAFDTDYSDNSTAIDLASLDKADEKSASETQSIGAQLQDAAADLPGDANSREAAIKTLDEQN